MAITISKNEENINIFVVELAALLHDIADHKFHGGDLTVGPRVASEWLLSIGVENSIADHVATIISEISFKGANVSTPMSTKEGMIVQDADRLDCYRCHRRRESICVRWSQGKRHVRSCRKIFDARLI